jgi:cytochrome P450
MKEAFMPFAAGPRRCPGQPLAEAEVYSVLPRLIQEFEFTVESKGRLENFVTLHPVGAKLMARRSV